jgi:hypothetical protein
MLPSGPAWAGDVLVAEDNALSPHAFYVHQDPGVRLERHYHDSTQFQVVVRGGGRLGTHDVQPFSVHYASYQSVYGPLVAGEKGLDYITLRAVCDRTIHFFPEDKARMDRKPRREQSYADALPTSEAELSDRSDAETVSLIKAVPGGANVWLLRQPGNSRVSIARTDGAAGQFVMVINGTARLDGGDMERLSIAWLRDGVGGTLDVGDHGAEVLLLQLPAAAIEDVTRMQAA